MVLGHGRLQTSPNHLRCCPSASGATKVYSKVPDFTVLPTRPSQPLRVEKSVIRPAKKTVSNLLLSRIKKESIATTSGVATTKKVSLRPSPSGVKAEGMRTRPRPIFEQLAVFRPGTIVGNKHTPGWAARLAKLLPKSVSWGAIEQETIGRAFAGWLFGAGERGAAGVAYFDNEGMRALAGLVE